MILNGSFLHLKVCNVLCEFALFYIWRLWNPWTLLECQRLHATLAPIPEPSPEAPIPQPSLAWSTLYLHLLTDLKKQTHLHYFTKAVKVTQDSPEMRQAYRSCFSGFPSRQEEYRSLQSTSDPDAWTSKDSPVLRQMKPNLIRPLNSRNVL